MNIESTAACLRGLSSETLSKVVKGELNLLDIAKAELAQRGHDVNGKWVGFKAAKEQHGIVD